MRPSSEDLATISGLTRELNKRRVKHDELLAAYNGTRQVEMIGMAAPERMRGFEFPLNWCRVTVDSVENRQEVKTLIRPGSELEDPALREAWESNDMDLQAPLLHRENLVQGHAFAAVSTNPDDREHPLITVESSRSMIAHVDPARRRIKSALRVYAEPDREYSPQYATLYLPEKTVWVYRDRSAWEVVDVDKHNLGRVPVVMSLNRRLPGAWTGESEMADVMGPMDMATRTLMNLQIAMEIAAIPRRWAVNVAREDFVDHEGKPKPSWEAAMDAVWASVGKNGAEPKFGQFDAADPGGFVKVITALAEQCSSITGLPVRYFGQNTANPASEGAIRADEARLIKNVERKNREMGAFWGWTLALYERFRTGEWMPASERIAIEWHDPATPTVAQRMDAVVKARQSSILSQAGAWDELGWSEARKAKERAYFAEEASDPELQLAAALLNGGNDGNVTG